jgi:hypothetical protein
MTAVARRPLLAVTLALLLGTGLLGTGLIGAPAVAQQRVGVNSAVNPDATGIPPGAAPRRLVLGQEVVFNEHITTGPEGQTQILFIDQSTMTVGPRSDMVIDEFVYDPNAGTGKLAASLTRGVFRFVGGKLSKQDNAVTMQTPSATIGIRGGLILVNLTPDGQLQVIFGYGAGVTVTGLNGLAQTITRPGFQVTVAGRGATPSAPAPAPPGAAAALLAQLDGRPGGNGGARTIPTDTMVANSGIAAAVSSTVGVQAQAQQPPNVGSAVQQATTSLQLAANSQVVQQSIMGASQGTSASLTSSSVMITYAGLVKITTDPTVGFTDQSSNGRIPYTTGALTFPPGSPQNGVFSASLGSAGKLSFPLVPGNASFGPANTSSPFGPLTGTSFLSADNTFFYANLQAPGLSGRGFIFGGQAVPSTSPLLTTGPAATQLYTFALQQDAALQSPIPFITQTTGGNIPNPSISPYYVVAPGQSPFGAAGTSSLQGNLAIDGTGAAQTSALVVQTGNFLYSSDTGSIAADGEIRGSFRANGTSPPIRINSTAATVPDGNGNNVFGTGTGSLPISGFVLDQNAYSFNRNLLPNQVARQVPLGGTASNYAFNQPAIPTLTSNTVLGTRTTQTLSGYFGGIMYPVVAGAPGSPYAVTGSTSVSTNATNNQVAAMLNGADPFGTNTLTVQFGTVTGPTFGRATFVDDTRYAALESPDAASQVNGTTLPSAPGGSGTPQVGFVTSGVVSNSLLPNGLCQQCQFVQWGYWTGELDTPNSAGTVVRQDLAHINPWIAGVVSTSLPPTGVGTFTGNAFGSVVNSGASYLASGGFTNTYNFGNHTGAFTISNFDGKTVSGTVNGLGAGYSGSLSGSGLTGSAKGSFFGNLPGNPATETGGNFALQGPSYLASGIFAGHR